MVSEKTAREVLAMMEEVTAEGGTAKKARVAGYRMSGKTGTARKAIKGGYSKDLHASVFAGVAPAGAPRLVMVVMIDEPTGVLQNGGDVAAPVFSAVMDQALRLINVAPDAAQVPAPSVAKLSSAQVPPQAQQARVAGVQHDGV